MKVGEEYAWSLRQEKENRKRAKEASVESLGTLRSTQTTFQERTCCPPCREWTAESLRARQRHKGSAIAAQFKQIIIFPRIITT